MRYRQSTTSPHTSTTAAAPASNPVLPLLQPAAVSDNVRGMYLVSIALLQVPVLPVSTPPVPVMLPMLVPAADAGASDSDTADVAADAGAGVVHGAGRLAGAGADVVAHVGAGCCRC
jgi:hypothetical protein